MEANGVNHHRVPPYHLSSYGAAENLVKSVKRALQKSSSGDSVGTKISHFFANYRNMPHSITGRTPVGSFAWEIPMYQIVISASLSVRLLECKS